MEATCCQKDGAKGTFRIHEYYPIHKCHETSKIKNAKSTWLAKVYKHQFLIDPTRKVSGLRDQIQLELKVNVTRQQVHRARQQALEMLHGTAEEQYGSLYDYRGEILSKNPGSTVLVIPDNSSKFDKFYCCLVACKEGFKMCMPIIGVDGTHVSGPYGGIILTAVGIDPNYNVFPIAWALVQSECFLTWDWFLSTLETDLGLQDHSKWTFMSDKQKGLIKAFQKNFKESENRFCVKHLHDNMKTVGFKGEKYKYFLWDLATSCTPAQFQSKLDELNLFDEAAVKWLSNKPPSQWSRAFFDTLPQCDMLLNNGCETFNSCIVEARKVPIITMLDWIMEYVMKRLKKNRDICNRKWKGAIFPKIEKIIRNSWDTKSDCFAFMSNSSVGEFVSHTGSRYSVNLDDRTCGCRRWDISGIPCNHALACICDEGKELKDYVHKAYHVATYKKCYEHAIVPINGRAQWNKTGVVALKPPNEGRSAGRPKTTRRIGPDEVPKSKKRCRGKPDGPSRVNQYKMKRQQTTCTCSYCHEIVHNNKSCPTKKENEANGLGSATTEQLKEVAGETRISNKTKAIGVSCR